MFKEIGLHEIVIPFLLMILIILFVFLIFISVSETWKGLE